MYGEKSFLLNICANCFTGPISIENIITELLKNDFEPKDRHSLGDPILVR